MYWPAAPVPGTLEADAVAEITLNALGKGPMIIPGVINKAGHFILARLLSRKAAIAAVSAERACPEATGVACQEPAGYNCVEIALLDVYL